MDVVLIWMMVGFLVGMVRISNQVLGFITNVPILVMILSKSDCMSGECHFQLVVF